MKTSNRIACVPVKIGTGFLQNTNRIIAASVNLLSPACAVLGLLSEKHGELFHILIG
jgi:hypothetical protein